MQQPVEDRWHYHAALAEARGRHRDIADLTNRTWLGARSEPWATDFDTLYAMTHTVYHLTDFGAHPSRLPSPPQTYLHAWLPAWIEV